MTDLLQALNTILATIDEDELEAGLAAGSTLATAIDQLEDLLTDLVEAHVTRLQQIAASN